MKLTNETVQYLLSINNTGVRSDSASRARAQIGVAILSVTPLNLDTAIFTWGLRVARALGAFCPETALAAPAKGN